MLIQEETARLMIKYSRIIFQAVLHRGEILTFHYKVKKWLPRQKQMKDKLMIRIVLSSTRNKTQRLLKLHRKF
jgi:hypothetical protein